MSLPVIEVKDLTFSYNSLGTTHTAIENVNLKIEKGELVGIIGHTGSGKSTLIQHLNGLLKPNSGTVLIDGEDIFSKECDLRKIRFKVGLVFQYPEYQLFEETVYNDIAFGPKNMGLSPDEIDKRVKEAAAFTGVEDYLNKSPFDLSGGQKRRVAIAGVIAMDPEILILDEPAAGLDPKGRDKILGQIKKYQREKGNTVLLVSHSMEDIAKLATKVLVMADGKVEAYDIPEKIFADTERIEKIGLAVPQITEVFEILKKNGIEIKESIFSVEYAKKVLLSLIGEGEDA
ncbi:MAG: energy-coupling factor transporter ATPase [Oscillospiraceae bacterium]|nr:energy-coupling factor transporter ATPase [Oscillospiraceae bacterium]